MSDREFTPEQLRVVVDAAEAAVEAVYGCEGEISGARLRRLSAAIDRLEVADVRFEDAMRRGQRFDPSDG